MNRIIKDWNVESGNLYSLGSDLFEENQVRVFEKDVQDAIGRLSKKVLESDKGSQIASDSYWKNRETLFCAVAFSEEKGLWVKVNGVEHCVAKADAVFKGTFPGLEEIKKIQEGLERKGFVSPPKTIDKTREVFSKVMEERGPEAELPSLVERASVQLKAVWTQSKEFSSAVSSKISFCSAVQVFGEFVFSLVGLSAMKMGFDDSVSSLRHNDNFEKFFLACSTLMAGVTTISMAVLFLVKKVAMATHHIFTAALAGAAFPFVAFLLYGSVLMAAIYKFYVQMKFRSELKAMNQKEALVWLKQQTQLSSLEMKEHEAKGADMSAALHAKWEQFTLRIGDEVAGELLDPDKLDFALTSDVAAKQLIERILASNKNALWCTAGSILANTLGLIGSAIILTTIGHALSIGTAALFVISAVISLYIDLPKLRENVIAFVNRAIPWIKENGLRSLEVIVDYSDIPSVCKKDILAWIRLFRENWIKSEEALGGEESSRLSLRASSNPIMHTTSTLPQAS